MLQCLRQWHQEKAYRRSQCSTAYRSHADHRDELPQDPEDVSWGSEYYTYDEHYFESDEYIDGCDESYLDWNSELEDLVDWKSMDYE